MHLDTSAWTGEGAFTQLLIDRLTTHDAIDVLRVEDAPASRADAGYAFISNEIFVRFKTASTPVTVRRFGFPWERRVDTRILTLQGLEAFLADVEGLGPPDYADEGMLQYLRTDRIVAPYQTRGVKVVELVRIYEAGGAPRR